MGSLICGMAFSWRFLREVNMVRRHCHVPSPAVSISSQKVVIQKNRGRVGNGVNCRVKSLNSIIRKMETVPWGSTNLLGLL